MLTCGDGSYGRLGHGDEEDQAVPKMVTSLFDDKFQIVQVMIVVSTKLMILQKMSQISSQILLQHF